MMGSLRGMMVSSRSGVAAGRSNLLLINARVATILYIWGAGGGG